MPFIGTIIKGFIDVRDKLVGEKNPIDEQEGVLQKLLEKAKDTTFGKHYDFGRILASKDPSKTFSKSVPHHDYNKLNEEWREEIHNGETDVTWPGSPDYFALRSGTTGNENKRIPVTGEMIESIRNAGIEQVYALSNFDLPADFFEKGILMLGSSTDLKAVDSHEEGEINEPLYWHIVKGIFLAYRNSMTRILFLKGGRRYPVVDQRHYLFGR